MNSRPSCAALITLLAVVASCHRDPDTLVRDGYDEQEMKEAIQRARSELPKFIAALEARSGSDFAVKAPISQGKQPEHFWLTSVSVRKDQFEGEIGNDPGIIKGVKMGQKWTVGTNEISDWMFLRDEKMHGNYTMRPLLKTMDPAKAREWKRLFAEP